MCGVVCYVLFVMRVSWRCYCVGSNIFHRVDVVCCCMVYTQLRCFVLSVFFKCLSLMLVVTI